MKPISTSRLIVRAPRRRDAVALHARRNDAESARFQDWPIPYPMERAVAAIEAALAVSEPTSGRWAMYTVTGLDDVDVYGDMSVRLADRGRNAEIVAGFAREHRGRGLATEATEAMVQALFDRPDLARIGARVHPENLAWARVLERAGFEFEGELKASFGSPVAATGGGERAGTWLFGLTRAGWLGWTGRPTRGPTDVALVEIDHANRVAVAALVAHRTQRRFVAPVANSFAAALFPPLDEGGRPYVPWLRAISADGELAGMVMTAEPTETSPEPMLWRLLVDRRHQRRGIGDRALDLIIERYRSLGCESLLVSWIEGIGSPRPFYERRGFRPTGERDRESGEVEARLLL